MLRLTTITCIALLLWSCEDRRSFEPDSFDPEVVVNSIISTDSIWKLELSYTKSIFDPSEFTIINDADVRVHNLSNGQSFFLEKKKSGFYERELKPVEGHEYALDIHIEGEQDVRAMTYVPSVLEVEVVSNFSVNPDGTEAIEIDIEITDNPQEENYYVWELLEVDQLRFAQNSSSSHPVSTIYESPNSTDDPVDDDAGIPGETNSNESNGLLSPNHIFSFNADEADSEYQKKDLNSLSFLSESDVRSGKIANRLILDSSFISDPDQFDQVNEQETPKKVPLFELKVMAVSSDLYEYLQSYELYRKNDIRNTSISDPVIIHSNIENGLGIFGGYNLKSFYIY